MSCNGEIFKGSYQVQLIPDVHPDQTITQDIYTEYTSTPAGFRLIGRDHNSTNGWAANFVTLTVKIPTIQFVVYATDIQETPVFPSVLVNIGEIVTYRATIWFPESQCLAVVTIALPDGIIYESASVISIGPTIQNSALAAGQTVTTLNPQLVTFNFSTINLVPPNNLDLGDSIVVEACWIQTYH